MLVPTFMPSGLYAARSATTADLQMMEELCLMVKETSLCGLGQSAPNPVLSTIKNFRVEYEEHISQRKCRAKVCATY